MSYGIGQPLRCLQHPDHHGGEVSEGANAMHVRVVLRVVLSEQLQQEPVKLKGVVLSRLSSMLNFYHT